MKLPLWLVCKVQKNLNPAVHLRKVATTRGMVASHRVTTLWNTVIGKKVVMTVTGNLLIGFVIAHMFGNLKMLAGSDEINTYPQFLREVGWPEFGYRQLQLVRIVPLLSMTLHISAPVHLTRTSRATRTIEDAPKTR